MADFMYGPIEDNGKNWDLEPLELDDEDYDNESDYADESYEDDYCEDEDEYEEPGLQGWDDLMPFGSFSDGYGWDETL